MRRRLYSMVWLGLGVLWGKGPGSGAEGLPNLLSQTGLYVGGSGAVDPRNLPYAPQYPLWSDGLGKARWVYVPQGSKVDIRNPDAWRFPEGTKFWKEFSWKGRKVETRLLWKMGGTRWVYATYVWKSDQSDAVLAPEGGVRDHVELVQGKRHSIPSVADCKGCHENGKPEPLGFTALQLSEDRDPLAPHREPLRPGMVTLKGLAERGLLSAPLAPGQESPRIPSANPRTRAVLGYLDANCGSCHKAEGPYAYLGLQFRYSSKAKDEASHPGFATTVGKEGKWGLVSAPPGEGRRVRPGAPELSTVHHRMAQRGNAAQMPNLGTVLVDQEAVELVRRWIAEDLKPK